MRHRRKDRSCELCDNQILDEEDFPELVQGRNTVVVCDFLQQWGGKVIVKIVEWPTNPHLHRTKQVEHRRCKGYCSCHAYFSSLVTRAPLPDRSWSERNADQQRVIGGVRWSLLRRPWT